METIHNSIEAMLNVEYMAERSEKVGVFLKYFLKFI